VIVGAVAGIDCSVVSNATFQPIIAITAHQRIVPGITT
jgi:hypothetical protein